MVRFFFFSVNNIFIWKPLASLNIICAIPFLTELACNAGGQMHVVQIRRLGIHSEVRLHVCPSAQHRQRKDLHLLVADVRADCDGVRRGPSVSPPPLLRVSALLFPFFRSLV